MHAKIIRSLRPFRFVLESGARGLFPEIAARRGPHHSRCELVRAFDVSSLRLAQRILTVFVQALDFNTVEALVANLQPGAKGSGCAQVFDGIANGLSRCRKTPVVLAATLCAFRQEKFSRRVVIKGRLALALMRVTPYEVHSL
jgi:hypothetical protein